MVSGNNQDLEKVCGALLDLALKRGAPDNVTVLLAER
jgi:serine/threonine protein phosphatase PrpC